MIFLSSAAVTLVAWPIGHLRDRMGDVVEGKLDRVANVGGLDTFGLLSSRFNEMVAGLRQREFLRETFGRYVTKQVAEAILAGNVELGGERRTATVLFADIRGFTTMSEQLPPEEVVAFLNRYLEAMVSCVLDHHGVLDKFIGDAVMAVFGAPVSQGSPAADALAAVRCAIAMSGALDQLNAMRTAAGSKQIEIGIGVHTGELIAGNIGSARRMEYTVVGDTVNVTSRIEGLTKTFGRRIMISDTTARLVGHQLRLEKVDTVDIRGRTGQITLHSPKTVIHM
jgi:adenylate cyclase